MEKLFVGLIVLFVIIRKVQKEKLNLKFVITKDPVTGWFKSMQMTTKK